MASENLGEYGSVIDAKGRFGGSEPPGPPLPPAGGGGTFDGMEARLKRLEDDLPGIKTAVERIASDVSYMRGRLDSMPTTVQLLMFIVAVFVAVGIFKYLPAPT